MEGNDTVLADIRLSINGVPIRFKVPVPAMPVTARAMLPVFHELSQSFSGLSTRLLAKADQQVSCAMGCTACCRQTIPVAEIEIYDIARLVREMPEPRRTEVKERFETLYNHFQEKGWFEKLNDCHDEAALKEVVLEYFFEHTNCPFLEEGACSIYKDRPIACREYMVTSPRENCDHPIATNLRMVPLLIDASTGVRRVARSGNLSGKSIIPLIAALRWADQYPETLVEKTGEAWLAEFFAR